MSFCAIGISVKAVTIVKGDKLGTYTINSPLRIISHQHDLKLQYDSLKVIFGLHVGYVYQYEVLCGGGGL